VAAAAVAEVATDELVGEATTDAVGEAMGEVAVVAAVVVEELLASQADNTTAARTLAVTADCTRNDLRLSLIVPLSLWVLGAPTDRTCLSVDAAPCAILHTG
jgi:hypothetical protein